MEKQEFYRHKYIYIPTVYKLLCVYSAATNQQYG